METRANHVWVGVVTLAILGALALFLALGWGATAAAQLTASTYLGGSGTDLSYALASHPSGGVVIAGETTSSDFPIVGVGTYDTSHNGGEDVFVARIDASGAPVWTTYLGGGNAPTLGILITDFTKAGNQWPRAAVVAITMIVTLLSVAFLAVRFAYKTKGERA